MSLFGLWPAAAEMGARQCMPTSGWSGRSAERLAAEPQGPAYAKRGGRGKWLRSARQSCQCDMGREKGDFCDRKVTQHNGTAHRDETCGASTHRSPHDFR